MSLAEKVTTSKILFDTAFDKATWLVQPSIIPFLTPMVLCDENITGMLVKTAPVNHNKLTQNKALQKVNTILGNACQSKNKLSRQNQDFGIDTCIIIKYNDSKVKELPDRYQVNMKDLHPEDGGLRQPYYWGMFPNKDDKLSSILQSDQFQQLLKTDATTRERQQNIAKYFEVDKQRESTEQTSTLQSFY